MERRRDTYVVTALIFLGFTVVFTVLTVAGLGYKTSTYDEAYHLRYAERLLLGDAHRREGIDDSKMPFSILNLLPSLSLEEGVQEGDQLFDTKLYRGRLVTIAFAILIGFYVYRWSYELYGFESACFSLILYTFSPNILAHARLITTDMFAAGMTLLSLYYFWKAMQCPGVYRFTISACALGLSQLAKFNCIFLYPLCFLLGIVGLGIAPGLENESRSPSSMLSRLFIVLSLLSLYLLVAVLIINLGFYSSPSFIPLSEYSFRSELFQTLLSSFPKLSSIPFPLPFSYIDGLDFVRYRDMTGEGFGSLYLLGEVRTTGNFPGYFLYAFLFKVPLAVQALIILSVIDIFHTGKWKDFCRNELFLIFPALFFLLYMSYFSNAHAGFRFVLPGMPLFFVLSGRLLRSQKERTTPLLCSLSILSLWLIVSVLSYAPHFLSYMNELVWDRKNAYQYLSDSNIDWNQNRNYLKEYLKKNPDAVYQPPGRQSGKLVVSVNALTGVWVYGISKAEMPARYRWLRDNYAPIDHIAYSYLVYDIKEPPPIEDKKSR